MSLDSYFDERVEIARLLEEAAEPSLLNVYQTDLPKVLVLAVASRFERDVVDHIETFFTETSQHDSASIFVKKKALNRQYHQLFEWDRNTATSFTGLFGPDCTENFKIQVKENEWLETAVQDFMYLGRTRNQLVHMDLASFSVALTPAEVQSKYLSAARFVAVIPHVIRVESIPTFELEPST